MNAEVTRSFGDVGLTVVRDIALQCTSWTGIAAVTPIECRDAIRRLDGTDVDGIDCGAEDATDGNCARRDPYRWILGALKGSLLPSDRPNHSADLGGYNVFGPRGIAPPMQPLGQ